ncbi:MAG: DegT/DnrJ/EryC1/StrS family aminotransferase [archaeon]
MPIPIAKPIIGEEEKRAVLAVLESGMIAAGKNEKIFEENFAKFIGTKFGVATSSGTAALHTAMGALGLGPGDEVITTPFTFIASSDCIRFVGAKPVFVDINPESYCIDETKIEAAITKKTRVILPVHLYGQVAEMGAIAEIARKHNLFVVEDAAQAHGAEYKGKRAGSLGTAGCFSMYATKNMTTGEGGMVTTNDEALAKRARMFRFSGMDIKYRHDFLGYNYRMTDVEAALGVVQLAHLEERNELRRRNAGILTAALSQVPGITVPKVFSGRKHVFHQYVIRVLPEFGISRDDLAEKLKEKGIGTGVHYPIPVHKQASYTEWNKQSLPEAEKAAEQVLALPVHAAVSEEDARFVAETITGLAKR